MPKSRLGDRKPRVIALSQGYVGYIDVAQRVANGTGEAGAPGSRRS